MATTEGRAQIAIRLPRSLLARVDAYKDVVRSGMPGAKFTRADAVRVLLERALAEAGLPAEAANGKPKRRGSRS